MRNLAGRLTARSTQELARIAEFWQVPLTGRDRHAVVGQLYSEMRELRSARDVWERLDEDERRLVQLLALDERAVDLSRTIEDLGGAMERETGETRSIAASLYRKGILFREGDDDELPIGDMPRVLLPRELTAVFRRVQDEIDAGDLTATPLSALLALLDDVEIEHAAEVWGVPVVPGLQSREELTEHLLRAVGIESRRSRVTNQLQSDARKIWDWLEMREPQQPVELESAMRGAELIGEGDQLALRRRHALGELEDRVVVWHSYDPLGNRLLFVPAEIVMPGSHIQRTAEPPAGLNDDQVTKREWRHPFAVAWDVMTMLRAIHQQDTQPFTRFDQAPAPWLALLNNRLWNADSSGAEPSAGYLPFLAALARNENVIQGGGPGAKEPMSPGRSWKLWRSRSFADQLAHLIWWWNASPEWIEGSGRDDVFISNAALPQFRRKLVVLLATLDPWSWYRVGDIARWIVRLDPDILGVRAGVATARAMPAKPGESGWGQEASAAVVEETLRSAFVWFGLIDLGVDPGHNEVLRVAETLRLLEGSGTPVEEPPPPGSFLLVSDDLLVRLRAPTPLRVWVLSAFADQVELQPEATYQITESSIERAFSGGATMQDVVRFLESEQGASLSKAAAETIHRWAGAYRRVWLRPFVVIEPDDDRQSGQIERIAREAGWSAVTVGGQVHVPVPDAGQTEEALKSLVNVLSGAGFAPQIRKPPPEPDLNGQPDDG